MRSQAYHPLGAEAKLLSRIMLVMSQCQLETSLSSYARLSIMMRPCQQYINGMELSLAQCRNIIGSIILSHRNSLTGA